MTVHEPTSSVGKLWVNGWRKVYHPLGFQKGYNFPLFVIMVGSLMGFTLARVQMFDLPHLLKLANPWEAPLYASYKKVPILLHVITVLLASFLVCFQFVPAIRHKFLILHRLNGYMILTLFIISEVGAFMCLPTSGGTHPSTRVSLGTLGAITTVTVLLAYYNIKRLRIDLHREWMFRTWVYAGSVITARLINLMMFQTMKDFPGEGPWYSVQTCSEIFAQYAIVGIPDAENPTAQLYPGCTATSDAPQVVRGSFTMGPENASSMINVCLTVSQWVAMALHAILLEVYFRYTQDESERLKKLSRERRIARGWESNMESGVQEITPATEKSTPNKNAVATVGDSSSSFNSSKRPSL